MNTRKVIALFCVAGLVPACEKVIDIELNEANKQTVVEAVIKDKMGENYVLLSESIDVYADNTFPVISDAFITVRDEVGNVYVFEEIDSIPGKYTCPTLEALPGKQYSLEINIDGKIITASSITNSEPLIDSLSIISDDFGLAEFLGFSPNQISYNSTDPGDEANYYHAYIWLNGVPSQFLYIGHDEHINGQHYNAPFIGDLAHDGDSVKVVLESLDKALYDYLYSFANQDNSSPFSASPGNPVSNVIGDNTVGYFAATLSDTTEIVVPE